MGLTFYFILINGIVSYVYGRHGQDVAGIFYFCCICMTGLLFTLATGVISIQGSILYIYSIILVYFFGELFSKAMSTHTLTFQVNLLCQKFYSVNLLNSALMHLGNDSRTMYHKVGKILVLNIQFVMTCICECM